MLAASLEKTPCKFQEFFASFPVLISNKIFVDAINRDGPQGSSCALK